MEDKPVRLIGDYYLRSPKFVAYTICGTLLAWATTMVAVEGVSRCFKSPKPAGIEKKVDIEEVDKRNNQINIYQTNIFKID
jgi:hypothetical protein